MLEYDIGLDGEKREIGRREEEKDVVKEEMDKETDMWTDSVS